MGEVLDELPASLPVMGLAVVPVCRSAIEAILALFLKGRLMATVAILLIRTLLLIRGGQASMTESNQPSCKAELCRCIGTTRC